MARKKRVYNREYLPDPRFGDELASKFINTMMWCGKKTVSQNIFYGALEIAGQRSKTSELEVFNKAIDNVRPLLEVRSRRVGGANYQVPTEVRAVRRDTLAIRWIIQAARGRSEKSMKDRLANEFLDALQSRGGAFKKREDTHKMAEANRAFAHYRW